MDVCGWVFVRRALCALCGDYLIVVRVSTGNKVFFLLAGSENSPAQADLRRLTSYVSGTW